MSSSPMVPQHDAKKEEVLDLQHCHLRAADLFVILEKLASSSQNRKRRRSTKDDDGAASSSAGKQQRQRNNSKRTMQPGKSLLRKAYGVTAILGELDRLSHPPRCINLTRNRLLGDASIPHLTRFLPQMVPRIHTLNLSSCGMTAHGVDILCQWMMEESNPIQWLSLWKNTLGPEGALALARLLQHPQKTSLHTLLIHDCQLGPKGYDHLAPAIAVNRTLRHWMVGDRRGDSDTPLIRLAVEGGGGLTQNRTLQSLGFCHLEITPAAMTFLICIVKANPSLTCIHTLQRDICQVIPQQRFPIGQQFWHVQFHSLEWWLGFNQCGRAVLERQTQRSSQDNHNGIQRIDNNTSHQDEWWDALVKAAAHKNGVDYAFLLLQGNPNICQN